MEKNWPTSYGGRGKGAVGETGLNKLYLWDQANRFNVTYRTYGEFVNADNTARIPVLKGHFTPEYPTGDLKDPDTMRYRIWEKDFDSLMAQNALPPPDDLPHAFRPYRGGRLPAGPHRSRM